MSFLFPPPAPTFILSLRSGFNALSIKHPKRVAEWTEGTFVNVESIELLVQALKTHKILSLLCGGSGYKATFTFSIFDSQKERLYHWIIRISPIRTDIPKVSLNNDPVCESTSLFQFDPEDSKNYRADLTKE